MAIQRHPLLLFGRISSRTRFKGVRRAIHGPARPDEYTAEANYPELEKHGSRSDREFANLQSVFRSLKTVEEKQLYINKPKYYGWYSCVMNPDDVPVGCIDFVRYTTNTTLVDGKLPDTLNSLEEVAQKEAERLEPSMKALISKLHRVKLPSEVNEDKAPYQDPYSLAQAVPRIAANERRQQLVQNIHRYLHLHLSAGYEHLRSAVTDVEARNEAFWMRSGFAPDSRSVNKRTKLYEFRESKNFPNPPDKDAFVNEPYDRCLQITNTSMVQMRSNAMLDKFVDVDDKICQTGDVPRWNFDANASGFHSYCQHGVNIPAVWPGSGSPFTNLMYVSDFNCDDRVNSETRWSADSDHNDRADVLTTKAIMAAFSVLLPTAVHLGFDTVASELTRPLVTNVVVTDGRRFKLASYQINKTVLVDVETDADKSAAKYPRNVCWHTDERDLYEAVDVGGNVVGFNRDVLADIVKLYVARPSVIESDVDTSQVLGPARHVANLGNKYNRRNVHDMVRNVYSRRPRHFPKADIQAWERIYRIRHPEQTFILGNREMPWYVMAKYDHKGLFHWHPEFRPLDYYNEKYKPVKFRADRYRDKTYKKVFPPLPPDESNQ